MPKGVAQTALAAWAALVLFASSTLMMAHWALPKPPVGDPALGAEIAALRPVGATRWLAVHVLYSDCPCSRRVFEHVLSRPRIAGAAEVMVLVGASGEMVRRARAQGFAVTVMAPEALRERMHVAAVPLLVVASPEGEVRYAGGYTSRKQGPDFQDAHILAELAAGREPLRLPLFGCATSRALSATLDPLGLRRQAL